jgi:hypothetical protein
LGLQLESASPEQVFESLTKVALARIDGARSTSVTIHRRGGYMTAAATCELARRADAIQYDEGSGPGLDTITTSSICNPSDLAHDPRWPGFGRRVSAECGLNSMLSFRLSTDAPVGSLNIYAEGSNAFDEDAVETGLMLAVRASLALAAAHRDEHAENLRKALLSSREIGIAMGVLMGRHKITRDQAFDLLRDASQRTNRKVNDIATTVADAGMLDNR